MKVSRASFLKMLGGGSAAAVLAGRPGSGKDLAITDKGAVPVDAPPGFDPLPVLTSGWVDVVPWVTYDRIKFPAGAELPDDIHFFATPAGMLCPYSLAAKDLTLTNMQRGGSFPPPNSMLVRKIHIVADGAISVEDARRVRDFAWCFYISNKLYAQGPLQFDLRAGPVERFVGYVSHADKVIPWDVRESRNVSETGLVIPSLCHFEVCLRHQRSLAGSRPAQLSKDGAGVDLLFGLEGLMIRSVQ